MQSSILKEDWPFILLLGLFLVCLSSANTFLQISGDSLFIARLGVEKLPLMYIVSALVLAFMATVIIPVIDRMERTKIYNITAGGLALALISCRLLITLNFNGIYYVIYIITYILEAVLFLEFWLIAGDVCHTRQAKRIFPVILGGSLISGIIAAFLSKTLARSIHTENILLISGLLCGLTIIFSRKISNVIANPSLQSHTKLPAFKRMKLDLRIVWQSKLVRVISFSFIFYTVLSFILEYEFNRQSSLYFTVAGEVMADRLTAFFCQVKGFIAISAILLQFLFSRKLINTLGVCHTYMIMPFVLFFGFFGLSMAPIPIFYLALTARFAHKAVHGSWYHSSKELLYNAIPNEKRGRVRAFHTTIMEPLGVALAGAVLILARNFSVLLALGLSLIYVIEVAFNLKKNYLAGIVEMLKEKSGRLWESMSGSFGQYGTKEIVSYLSNSLRDKDPSVRAFACEILSKMKRKDISHLFKGALKDKDIYVRKNAIEALEAIGNKETLKTIAPFLDDPDFTIQAQAIITSWKIGGERDRLKEKIIQLFKNEDSNAKLPAIEAAGNIPIPESLEYLFQVIATSHTPFRLAAIKALGKNPQKESACYLIKLLELRDNRLSSIISTTLASMGKIALESIRESLTHADIYSRHFLLKALEGISLRLPKEILKEIIPCDIREIYYRSHLISKLDTLGNEKAVVLLKDALLEENNKAQSNALIAIKLLDDNSERMRIVSNNLKHPDAFVRSNAIEALEHIGDPDLSAHLIGLLEGKGSEAQFPALTTSDILKELLFSPRTEPCTQRNTWEWLRATAIFSIGELKLLKFKDRLLNLLKDKDALIRANALEALTKMEHNFPPDLLQSLKTDPSTLVRKYALSL